MRHSTGSIYLSFAAACIFCGLTACNKTDNPPQAQAPASTVVADSDPAAGNLAPAEQVPAGSVTPATTTTTEPAPNPAPVTTQNYPVDNDNTTSADYAYDAAPPPPDAQDYAADSGYDTTSYDQPIEATTPPPPIPDYEQPPCPGDGYYWTPGYWAWDSGGYYWVPGAWVLAPWVDALWTPPYWGFADGYYQWHPGYWGSHIGFYGGVNYGFGYTGRGYYGAYWNHGALNYNRSVTNVNTAAVHNVYNYSAPVYTRSRLGYNGGHGGLSVQPTAQERAVVHDPRTPAVAVQAQHAREAASNRAQFATAGHAPATLATARPLATNYKAPAAKPPAAAMRAAARPATPPAQNRPNERPNTAENHPAPGQPAIAPGRSASPESRQAQSVAPAPPGKPPVSTPATRQQRPEAPAAQQAPAAAHPAPQQNRPEPQRMSVEHPAPQVPARPQAQPMNVPRAPQQAHPATPEQRPAPPAQRPVPEAQRPAAPQRAAPEAQRPAPEAHPAPPARPAPQAAAPARPAAPPHEAPRAAAPQPAPHAAPPAAHSAPAPQQKPEEKKDNK